MTMITNSSSVPVRKVLEMAEVAKQKKLNVVVGLQRHYQTSYRELMKRIQDGMIGEITSAQVYWNNDGVWVKERQAGQTEMEWGSSRVDLQACKLGTGRRFTTS
jgi:Predicted dehydrogenases and related proteins